MKDDTISRRAAIYVCLELMHERRKWLSDAGQKEINGIDAAMCAIRDLPSAQPTCNQLATDCISRQAAIDAIADGLKHVFAENQDIAEKLIGKLPSAHPSAEWIERTVSDDAVIEEWQSAKCSACGRYHTTPYMYYFDNYNYCPHCGARMRGDHHD